MSLILNQLKVVDSLIVPGTITTTSTPEGIRIANDAGYLSFFNTANNTRTAYIQGLPGTALRLSSESTEMQFYASGSQRMVMTTGGNVGINTTTPQTKLDVFVGGNNTFAASFGHNVGAGSFSGFSFGYQEQGNLNYRKSAWVFERTDGHGQGNNASGKIHLLLRNDGASSAISLTDSVMTIDSDASGTRSSVRVGIGTTSPNAKLQVNGGMTFGYGSDAAFYTGTEFDSSKYLILQNNTDSYGRIGLAINAKTFNGANTPSANDGWAIDGPRSGIRFRAWLTGDTDYQAKFTIQHLLANAQNANGDLGIFARGYSTSSPAFLLTGAGNVGIGITSPTTKLDVNGSANINGIVGASNGKLSLGILDINSGGTPSYIKINTTIPAGSTSSDFTVTIKGFYYNSARSMEIRVSWHYYLAQFWNACATSSGGWAPEIKLSEEGGFVKITLTSPGYWPKLFVESVYSSAYGSSYSSGWSWTDAAATNSPVTVTYVSDFGNSNYAFTSGLYATNFVDTNNSNYWCDPNGTSILRNIQIGPASGGGPGLISIWEAESVNNTGGAINSDASASSGQNWGTNTNTQLYGPYVNLPRGNYRFTARIKVADASYTGNSVRMQVLPIASKVVSQDRYIRGVDFSGNDVWETFSIPFKVIASTSSDVEFYVFGLNSKQIYVDYIAIFLDTDSHTQQVWGNLYANGNVGIGTTSPGHKLEVSGNALVTKLFVNSANASYDLYNNGTSYFNSTVAVNSWLYLNQNYGHSIVGLYDSTKYQGIFAMGDNYKLPANGATTGNLYGLTWSHPNAGGVAAYLNTHGMLALENGTFLAAVSGSIKARDDMRAPIFYDLNDTGYYCNPNGASNFYDLNFGGKLAFRQLSTNTVYGPNIYWGITQPNGVKLYYDEEFEYSSNSIQVYNNNGGTAVTITRKNSSFLDGHTQVPNSTGYVLEIKHDPATSSGTSPYNGGWYFATNTGAGKAFLCVFKMKIPSGRNISFHSNSTGTNSAVSWITNVAGTGQYEDYAIIVNSGTASWSSTFFFAIDGAATLFYTYLASATVYELTNVNDKVIGGSLGVGVNSQFSNCRFSLSSGNTSRFGISDGTVTSNMWTTSSTFYVSTETNHPMVFITNANERLRIAADGNVGIGTTSPSTPLHIYKTGLADNSTNALLTIDGKFAGAGVDTNDIVGIAFRVENSNNGSQTTTSIGSSYQPAYNGLLLQPSGGNVGIGVKDPLAKLHILSSTPTSVTSVFTNSDIIIDSNTNSYINFRQTADTGAYGGFVWTDNNHGAYIVFRNWQGSAATGGDSLIYGTYQDHIFQAGTSATINGRPEVMRILQNGSVGIGTTSPTTNVKLDVVGNIGIQSENSLRLYSSTNYSRIYASSITGLTIAGRFNGSMYNLVITAGSSGTAVLYALTDGRVNINPDGYDTLCSGLLQASSVQALNGSVSDQYGNLRVLPENAKTAAYTLAASDTGRLINITTGGITVPASVFSIGQVVTIYNNSASNQTITQGASVTMYLAGTATTGNRTLAQRGVATVICVASNTFVISGSGLT